MTDRDKSASAGARLHELRSADRRSSLRFAPPWVVSAPEPHAAQALCPVARKMYGARALCPEASRDEIRTGAPSSPPDSRLVARPPVARRRGPPWTRGRCEPAWSLGHRAANDVAEAREGLLDRRPERGVRLVHRRGRGTPHRRQAGRTGNHTPGSDRRARQGVRSRGAFRPLLSGSFVNFPDSYQWDRMVLRASAPEPRRTTRVAR